MGPIIYITSNVYNGLNVLSSTPARYLYERAWYLQRAMLPGYVLGKNTCLNSFLLNLPTVVLDNAAKRNLQQMMHLLS